MEPIDTTLRTVISESFTSSTPLDWALQMGAILIATVVGLFVRRHWDAVIKRRIKGSAEPASRIIALRGTTRLSFPLAFAVLILLFYGLLHSLGYPAGLLYMAWPLALAGAAISILIFLLRIGAGPGAGNRKTELFFSIVLWVVCAIYLLGWLPDATAFLGGIGFNLGAVRITLLGVIKFLLVASVLVLLALAAARMMEGRLYDTGSLDSGIRMGVIKVIRYSLVSVAILVALSVAGLDLTTLTVLGGALGIGVGFGLQKVSSNLISGFLLLFDRSIRPGDVISIGESFGWVEKMGARYLVVRDRTGVDTLIPNEELITTRVINWSYSDRQIRLQLPVQISYADDPRLAMQLMVQAAGVNDRVVADPTPVVRMLGFGSDGIDLELRVWIDDPEQGVNNVRSDINLAIWDAFKAKGITIPFPQRDLHIRRPGLAGSGAGDE